jgi:NTP pyrophosphatase (non-canonical NTP hydrolase)
LRDLQNAAVKSVQRRGFWQPENIPPAAYNDVVATTFTSVVIGASKLARRHRKDSAAPRRHEDARKALEMAQLFRLVEEVGELAEALEHNAKGKILEELADALIVLCQIAAIHEVDLESAVYAKLLADEGRGHLHGETNGNGSGGGIADTPRKGAG